MKNKFGWYGILLFGFPFSVWASNQAGIVIKNSTGEVITRCVEFTEASLTVETLLERSGFTLVKNQYDFGAAICFLHDDGDRNSEHCLNQPNGYFWNFFLNTGDGWKVADSGISTATVTQGFLVGLAYGAWDTVKLPEKSFIEVCGITSAAGLVIDHSDGSRKALVVKFPGETITGMQLLLRSGVSLITYSTSFGLALCSIDAEGQPADTCFNDPKGRFWNFNILIDDNQWISAPSGTSETIVRAGTIHGYLFGLWGTPQLPIKRAEILGIPSEIHFWKEYAR